MLNEGFGIEKIYSHWFYKHLKYDNIIISDNFKDFLEKIMTYNYKKRYSAMQLLKHTFLN